MAPLQRSWLVIIGVCLFFGTLVLFRHSTLGEVTTPIAHSQVEEDHSPKNCPPPPPPVNLDLQPKCPPQTYYPITMPLSSQNLVLKAPTAHHVTLRLNNHKGDGFGAQGYNVLEPARTGEDTWQFGVINTKPDVFVASLGHIIDVQHHYQREYRIYTLMKWILRVNRRDPERKEPLMMVDAGSNHGLFSMVASVSGAHTVAFEPQTHLRGVINFGARLNQIASRLRILPFAVLDRFTKVSISNYQINDGGLGQIDFAHGDNVIQTQTIRLDSIPSYDLLFPKRGPSALGPHDADFGDEYTKKIIQGNANGITKSQEKSLLLRQRIHFLKIDVEGFELFALESAKGLFEQKLVDHVVLEFGPPKRWEPTLDESLGIEEIQKRTKQQAKDVLKKAGTDWDFDLYLLPAEGWDKTIQWMKPRTTEPLVRELLAWDFDGKGLEQDEFEEELKTRNNIVTEYLPLPVDWVDDFIENMQNIGEMYVWMVRRDSNPAVLQQVHVV
ncbi:hypothetical protein VKS41_001573 [Umbelopsis sp. WA50703]